MKKKKTASANLENKRFMFFQIGIILSLSMALTAFEMKSYDVIDISVGNSIEKIIEIEYPPITVIPPIPKPPINITKLEVLEVNTKEEPPEVEIDAYVKPETEIPIWTQPDLPDESPVGEEPPFISVDEMPEFPGGQAALFAFLSKQMNYPVMAIEAGIKGVVYIGFVVEKDGSITDIHLMRGIGGGCDEEAMRVVQMMPLWKPGKQFSRTVRVQYTLPVRFVLQ